MKTRGRLFMMMLFSCCAICGSAQFRKYSNEFLNIGAGARGLAMGGAQVASAEDGNAGYFAKAWGFGFDAGFLYRTSTLRFGIAARDVTTTFNAWSFSFTDAEKQVLYLTNNDIPVKSTELTSLRLVPSIGYNFRIAE